MGRSFQSIGVTYGAAGFGPAPGVRPATAISWALALVLLWAVPSAKAQKPELQVTAAVENQQVYAGAPFTLQIQVQGSDEAERPDLSGLQDFQVQEAGGGQNNNQSISIVNGKISRVVQRGYTFNYRLTAKHAGDLTIPADRGQRRRADAPDAADPDPRAAAFGKRGLQTADRLSDQHCYVGQPVVMTVTWYVGRMWKTSSSMCRFLGQALRHRRS